MSTDIPSAAYTIQELRQMDRETARQTLPVAQFERWESLQDLYDQAEETAETWQDQAETVAEVTVNADMEQLGSRVDVFGNDLLVHADTESSGFRRKATRLEDKYDDLNADELEGVSQKRLDTLASDLTELLEYVIVRWNGTEWTTLSKPQRETILAEARAKWGVDGLLLAWIEISAAIQEDREETVGQIEKFREA